MKTEIKVILDEEEKAVLEALDAIHAAIVACNAAGTDSFRAMAMGSEDSPYSLCEKAFLEAAGMLFNESKMAVRLRDACLDSGEPPSRNLQAHAKFLLTGEMF